MELYAYICIYSLCSQMRYITQTNVRKKKVMVSDFVVSSHTPNLLLTMKNEDFLLKDP